MSALLRASVTADALDLTPGDDAPVLVDGSDTPVTASGLGDYTPTPGDRLLVQEVGGTLEIMQFLNRGTVPWPTSQVTVYHQATEPDDGENGDLWYDTANDNQLNRFSGGAWTPVLLGPDAVSDDIIAGKSIPSGSQITMEWGVQDPADVVETPAMLPDDTDSGAHSDGRYRRGLVSVGSNAFIYLKQVDVDHTAGVWIAQDGQGAVAETNLSGIIGASGGTQTEQPWGLTKLGSQYYTINSFDTTHVGEPTEHQWSIKHYNSSFTLVEEPAVYGPTTSNTRNSTTPVIATDGTHIIVAYRDPTSHKIVASKYATSALGKPVSTITSTTAVDWELLDLSYGEDFDMAPGEVRYVFLAGADWLGVGTGGPRFIISMDGSGVIHADEGTTIEDTGNSVPSGLAWHSETEQFFVNMSSDGLQTLTGASTPTDLWVAYTLTDTNLAGTGLHESGLSPALPITVPARLLPSWAEPPYANGAGLPGDDAANGVNLYFADGSIPDPVYTDFHLVAQGQYPDAPLVGFIDLTGPNPPAASNFPVGGAGEIASATGGFQVKGDGTGAWPSLTDGLTDEWNLEVADDLWTQVVLQNGTTQDPAQPLQYRKDATGTVHLSGTITAGLDSTVLFNIPAGYRPAWIMHYIVVASGFTLASAKLDTNGDFTVNVSGVATGASITSISIAGMTYLAEQ